MNISKSTKIIINLISILMLGWLLFVIYSSFTSTGIWPQAVNWASLKDSNQYYPAGAFAIATLIGVLPLLLLMIIILWIVNKDN